MLELLVLLLPVAFLSGWYTARNAAGDEAEGIEGRGALRSDYFKGINYLLNEQPDKALEVFIEVLEVDSETAETHLALGSLYRRRGEVDRAIRIHQNLIARPHLDDRQRAEALLELGQDYQSAGLLDRAENLFHELLETGIYRVQALRQLIDIYEQERDWNQAIDCARKLEQATGNQLGSVIAQYLCESAEQARAGGGSERALALARQALRTHSGCVRASLLEGDLLGAQGDCEQAIEAFKRVERQNATYLTETARRLIACYRKLGREEALMEYLYQVIERHGGSTATVAMSEVIEEASGAAAAITFIEGCMRERVSLRVLERLIGLKLSLAAGADADHLSMLQVLTRKMLEERAVYQCRHCGFSAKSLHWQCPGCKHWSTIEPIKGVEGE